MVLKIRTGSGYQPAVLSQLVEWVFSVDCIKILQARAKNGLVHLKPSARGVSLERCMERLAYTIAIQRGYRHHCRNWYSASITRSTCSWRSDVNTGEGAAKCKNWYSLSERTKYFLGIWWWWCVLYRCLIVHWIDNLFLRSQFHWRRLFL